VAHRREFIAILGGTAATFRDRIGTGDKDDRVVAVAAFAACADVTPPPVATITVTLRRISQRRQLIVVAERPAEVDLDILPVEKADLVQPAIERGHSGHGIGGRSSAEKIRPPASFPGRTDKAIQTVVDLLAAA
jgi:hypothetical protein